MAKTGENSGMTLLRHALRHKPTVMLVLLLVVLQVTFGILLARQLGRLIDVGLLADRGSFSQVFWFLVALWLFSGLAFFGRQLLTGGLAEKITHRLRETIVLHIGRATIPSLENTHSGDYISRLSNDMQAIRAMIAREMPGLMQGVLGFVVALIVMLTVSWQVTLLTVAMAPVMMLIASILGGRMGANLKEWQSDMARVNVLTQETVSGIVMTKAYNLRDYLAQQMHVLGQRVVGSAVKPAFTKGQLNAALVILSVVMVLHATLFRPPF